MGILPDNNQHSRDTQNGKKFYLGWGVTFQTGQCIMKWLWEQPLIHMNIVIFMCSGSVIKKRFSQIRQCTISCFMGNRVLSWKQLYKLTTNCTLYSRIWGCAMSVSEYCNVKYSGLDWDQTRVCVCACVSDWVGGKQTDRQMQS